MIGAELILACAPLISVDTMVSYVEQRSRSDPLAIHIIATDRWVRPKNKAQAVRVAKQLRSSDMLIEAGLGQIKSTEWNRYGLTVDSVFDSCSNLAASERVLMPPRAKTKQSSSSRKAGRKHHITKMVRRIAPRYSLDPRLVLAVIQAESSFNPKARSPKNAQGLMQLMPATAARFGVSDPWDPEQNVNGGMAYLRWLIDHFDGNVKFALAGYNAGERAVERHRGIPPYRETRSYVKRIVASLGRDSLSAPKDTPDPYTADTAVFIRYKKDIAMKQRVRPVISLFGEDAGTPGVQIEHTPDDAAAFGAFEETALTEEDAWESNSDLTSPDDPESTAIIAAGSLVHRGDI